MNDFLTQSGCQVEIAAIRRGEYRTWAEIGLLLCSVEFHGLWRQEATSFTEWLKHFAIVLKKGEGSLWRYLTSGRYYLELRKYLLAHGIACPVLRNVPERVSPENLELLSKLERVVPQEVLDTLAERIIAGIATRNELRDAWDLFKPILGGQTARGYLKPPKYDPKDPAQSQRRLEALVQGALIKGEQRWEIKSVNNVYYIFAHINAYPMPRIGRSHLFDLLMVTGSKQKPKRAYHGIIVISWGNLLAVDDLSVLKHYCDFLWIAIHERQFISGLHLELELPDSVGILVVTDNGVFGIEKKASSDPEFGMSLSDLKEGLLLQLLK